MTLKIGVDEAGRGCVLGPLCIGVAASSDSWMEDIFIEAGVKDSKKLSRNKIDFLKDFIATSIYTNIIYISPKEIDVGNLNEITMTSSISLFKNCIKDVREKEVSLFLDCPTSNTAGYSKKFSERLNFIDIGAIEKLNVIAENRADEKFNIVSAASVIAKHFREKELDAIRMKYFSEYGDIGSGYPSDRRTVDFLRRYYSINNTFPDESRLSWGTISQVQNWYEMQKNKGIKTNVKSKK